MERIRINSGEFWIKDSSGSFKFKSSYNYLISDTSGALTVGGTFAHPGLKIEGGNASTVNLTYNGFTESAQSLAFSFI
jgi:hypothetical protein